MASGKGTHEHRIISSHFSLVVESLARTVNPGNFAQKLKDAKVIGRDVVEQAHVSSKTESERIYSVISAVQAQIELDTTVYHQFIGILKDFNPHLAGVLSKFLDLQLKAPGVLSDLSNWQNLGQELGVDSERLAELEQSGKDPSRCKEEVIGLWVENDCSVSWEMLTQALDRMGEDEISRRIKDTYIPQPPPQESAQLQLESVVSGTSECFGVEESGSAHPRLVESPIKRQLLPHSDADSELESPAKRPKVVNGTSPELGDSSIRAKVNEFELQFETLTGDARCEIEEKQTSLKTFRHSLTCLPIHVRTDHQQYIEENLDKIHEAGNIEKIFLYLNLYWSFLDYSLLEYIVQRYGSIDLKRRMSQYVEDMVLFRQTTTVGQLIRIWPGRVEPPPNFSQVTSKLNKNASEYTLEELEMLRKRFCSQFRLSVLVLAGGSNNSVVIYWRIPSSLASELTAAVSLTESSFFEQLGVLKVDVDGFCAFEQNYPIESSSTRRDPQQTELVTDLLSQVQRLQLEKEELLARPQEQKTHPPPGQKLHQPPLKDPQVDSNSSLTKGDDTSMERKLDHWEESGAQQPQEVEHEKDSTATAELRGRLSATEAILKLERVGKEELQQQMVESEWQAKQAKVKLEETELINKQLLTEKDQLTAGIEQREAQMEWERKDKETTVRSFREREVVAAQRELELQKQMDKLTKIHTEKLAAKDGQLREHFESYQQLQSELQSKEQLIEQLQTDYESLKSQYTELQASYREVEDKSEHKKSSSARQDPQQTELVTDLLSQIQRLQLENEELLARPQEQKTHPPPGQKDVETTEEYDKLGEIQEKRPELELKGDSQPGQVTGNENQAEVYLQSKDEGQLDSKSLKQLLEIERKGKEALLRQLQESECRAKQLSDRVVYEEKRANDLVKKQEDQSAILQLTETQLQWEREKREAQEKNSVQLQLRMKELEFLAVKESHKKPFPSEPHHRAQLQSLREESKVLEQQQQLLEETASAAAEGQELQQRQVPSLFQRLEGHELRLHNVRVSDEEASTIAKNLREKKNLETLTLWKVKVSDSGLCAIVGAIRDNNSLKTFHLRYIQIPDQVAHALGGALRMNTVLQELILWGVGVSDEGMSVIAGALHVNRNLMKLKLFNTGVTDEGCSAIASALTVNRSLRSLDLWKTNVSDDGVRALAEALHVNQSLQTLEIDFAKVSDGAASEFVAAIEVNSSLKKLEVWNTSNTSKEVLKRLREITTRKSIELRTY